MLNNGTSTAWNVLFHGNTCQNNWGCIIKVHYQSNLTMNNVTASGNHTAKHLVGLTTNARLAVNNSILRNEDLPREIHLSNSGHAARLDYCNLRGGAPSIYVGGSLATLETSNLSDTDPGFVDPSSGRYQLLPVSPCIDAGNPSASWNDRNLPPGRGTARNDLGAYGGYAFAQPYQAGTRIKFGYDPSGNRTSRRMITVTGMASPGSLKSPANADGSGPDIPGAFSSRPAPVPGEAPGLLQVDIYPNPTRGLLRIDINGGAMPASPLLTVHDMTGRLLVRQEHIQATHTLDLSPYPAGTYILRIIMEQEVKAWKIVKE